MPQLSEEFATKLKERVEEYWAYVAQCDFDHASVRWKDYGLDPQLPLPRPQLGAMEDDEWRFSIPFDSHDVDHWYRHSTAILVAPMMWGGLGTCFLHPSMGETQQFASGLMGGITMYVGSEYLTTGTPGGIEPVWVDSGTPWEAWRAPSDFELGLRYSSHDFHTPADQGVAVRLPQDVKSPFTIDLGSCISYALGWVALVHGLRAVADNIPELNACLEATPLRGFAA